MKWIDIVGVRIHQLHSHAFKILKLFSINIHINPQVYSNPNHLVE